MTAVYPGVDHRIRIVAASLVVVLVIALPLFLWWRVSLSSASFADSEVLDNNHLGAATLDIQLGQETAGFSAENMAPGDVVSAQLELVNAGDLPLRYGLTASTAGGVLVPWLRFDLWETAGICLPSATGPFLATNVELTAGATVLLGAASSAAARTLEPTRRETLCLRASLPLEAPNSVQGQQLELELIVHAEHDLEASQ